MSFKTNAAAVATTTNENWKAQGFLNLYLPSKNGGRKKLGAIPLKMARPNEKTLIEWLTEDPARAQQIVSKLQIEFQAAANGDAAGFDLGE